MSRCDLHFGKRPPSRQCMAHKRMPTVVDGESPQPFEAVRFAGGTEVFADLVADQGLAGGLVSMGKLRDPSIEPRAVHGAASSCGDRLAFPHPTTGEQSVPCRPWLYRAEPEDANARNRRGGRRDVEAGAKVGLAQLWCSC